MVEFNILQKLVLAFIAISISFTNIAIGVSILPNLPKDGFIDTLFALGILFQAIITLIIGWMFIK